MWRSMSTEMHEYEETGDSEERGAEERGAEERGTDEIGAEERVADCCPYVRPLRCVRDKPYPLLPPLSTRGWGAGCLPVSCISTHVINSLHMLSTLYLYHHTCLPLSAQKCVCVCVCVCVWKAPHAAVSAHICRSMMTHVGAQGHIM